MVDSLKGVCRCCSLPLQELRTLACDQNYPTRLIGQPPVAQPQRQTAALSAMCRGKESP